MWLFENEPDVEIGEVVVGSEDSGAMGASRPTMTISVAVKDGERTVAVDTAKVAAMFEATSELGDWTGEAKLTPTVIATGIDASGKMSFTVSPGDGAAKGAFLRIRK